MRSLENAIANTKTQLAGRDSRRNLAWGVMAVILFAVPLYLYFTMAPDSAYKSTYAPIVVFWAMISAVATRLLATAMFAGRTTELELSLETAKAVLALSKAQGLVEISDEDNSRDGKASS